ncbi:carotenoid isomerooxygenase isoform X1 [Schistocerca piceifrons]|uniref:carotenoid isomerooxygenase isoform X1 n=1 Tax=Schistocerca piceifrons TaxID=274613 RepID=UPI001F5F9E12|nr:carotenoid isomerooxygenase isoform X1 [Schistocerca piceifrons]
MGDWLLALGWARPPANGSIARWFSQSLQRRNTPLRFVSTAATFLARLFGSVGGDAGGFPRGPLRASSTIHSLIQVGEPDPAEKTKPGERLYPNCDTSVWLRSCTHEVEQPLEGTVTGTIPHWVKGTLLRNGPGKLHVGEMRYKHLFDSAALLHRYAISNGQVTYQCRFLKSKTYKRNLAAQRIVVSEFGTPAVPDPCQTIFQRVAAVFNPGETLTDNAMISVYPFGDEFYTFTESPVIHRIDPATLDTMDRVNVANYLSIVNHTSHPLVMNDGTVYNIGMTLTASGPHYCVMKFPPPCATEDKKCVNSFEQATIVGTIPSRWRLHPSYMHSFSVTDNYFVILEQPLSLSVPSFLKCHFKNEAMIGALQWYPDEKTNIYLMNRKDGTLAHTFVAETFFYLHTINAYESDDHLVLDVCCYKDAEVLNCMYVEAMENCHDNPNYAQMFRSRPLRFVLPLGSTEKCDNEIQDINDNKNEENLVKLKGSRAFAFKLPCGNILVKPELLCNLGCETPQINIADCLGKPYRYFYAISADVDIENPGCLIKTDAETRQTQIWFEKNVFPSEPIFVRDPNGTEEDDGVVLSAIIWGKGEENKAGLLVLDAKSWKEVGRAVFETPGPVPKSLHGWFTDTVT